MVPPLAVVRPTGFKLNEWNWYYDIELKVGGDMVPCGQADKCRIQYSLSFTPLRYNLFNPVGHAGQTMTTRVVLQYANHIQLSGKPIKDIKVVFYF